jgi:hypothetical protein
VSYSPLLHAHLFFLYVSHMTNCFCCSQPHEYGQVLINSCFLRGSVLPKCLTLAAEDTHVVGCLVFCIFFTATETVHEIHVKYTYKSVRKLKLNMKSTKVSRLFTQNRGAGLAL